MKISFFAGNLLPIHARSLEERPMGGTETALIRLAEKLQKMGHEVKVYTRHESPPASQPLYLPVQEVERSEPIDIFISIRDWIPLFYKVPARKRFFWTGDSYDQFTNYGIGDRRVAQQIDAFLAVSYWQADQICQRSGFPKEKVFKLANGIEWQDFQSSEPKKEKRLIYSSTPYRGLQYVPDLYRQLLQRHSDLELRVFSSYKIYDQNIDFQALKTEIASLPGSSIQESILQKDLAREFAAARILFYPCSFEETSCITALEAMAAGCVVLSSHLGALPETVGDAGILIQNSVSDARYRERFIDAADKLLSEPEYFQELSDKARKRAFEHDWTKIASTFDTFLRKNL